MLQPVSWISSTTCLELPNFFLGIFLRRIGPRIFYDLHKAFECINHAVLLQKMKFYGVSGKSYNLVKSYLDGRYQKVILSHNNGTESTWEKIKQGVPQGSTLGPIFFLIYINDLPNLASIGTKILLYADDTNIIVTSPNFETKIDNCQI